MGNRERIVRVGSVSGPDRCDEAAQARAGRSDFIPENAASRSATHVALSLHERNAVSVQGRENASEGGTFCLPLAEREGYIEINLGEPAWRRKHGTKSS